MTTPKIIPISPATEIVAETAMIKGSFQLAAFGTGGSGRRVEFGVDVTFITVVMTEGLSVVTDGISVVTTDGVLVVTDGL